MQHCLLYEKPSERKHRHNQSLHDTVKPANLILDQHLQVETCALREMQGKNEIINWITSQHQFSNPLTKKGVSCQSLTEVIQTGKNIEHQRITSSQS